MYLMSLETAEALRARFSNFLSDYGERDRKVSASPESLVQKLANLYWVDFDLGSSAIYTLGLLIEKIAF